MAAPNDSIWRDGPGNPHFYAPPTATHRPGQTVNSATPNAEVTWQSQNSAYEAKRPTSPFYPPPVTPFEPPDSPRFHGEASSRSHDISTSNQGTPESQDNGQGGVSLPSIPDERSHAPTEYGADDPSHVSFEQLSFEQLISFENPCPPEYAIDRSQQRLRPAASVHRDETSRAMTDAYARLNWAESSNDEIPRQPAQSQYDVTQARDRIRPANQNVRGLPLWDGAGFDERWLVRPEEMWATKGLPRSPVTVSPRETMTRNSPLETRPTEMVNARSWNQGAAGAAGGASSSHISTFLEPHSLFSDVTANMALANEARRDVVHRMPSGSQAPENANSSDTLDVVAESTQRRALRLTDEPASSTRDEELLNRNQPPQERAVWRRSEFGSADQLSSADDARLTSLYETLQSRSAWRSSPHQTDEQNLSRNGGDSLNNYGAFYASSEIGQSLLGVEASERVRNGTDQDDMLHRRALDEVFGDDIDRRANVPLDSTPALASPDIEATIQRQLPPGFVPRSTLVQQQQQQQQQQHVNDVGLNQPMAVSNVQNTHGPMMGHPPPYMGPLLCLVPSVNGQMILVPWNPHMTAAPAGLQPSPSPYGFGPSLIGPAPPVLYSPHYPSPFYNHNESLYHGDAMRYPFPGGNFGAQVQPQHHQFDGNMYRPTWNTQPAGLPNFSGARNIVSPLRRPQANALPRVQPISAPPPVSILPGGARPIVSSSEWSNRFGNNTQASLQPSVTTLPYRPGSDTMYPMPMTLGSSIRLQVLTRNGTPSFEEAIKDDKLPFVETARETKSAEWGVMKLSNIPYAITRQEVLAFLGRNAKVITPDLGEAVHITMERTTGKTLECFVEFFSVGDAAATVNKLLRTREQEGRHMKLGDRHVDVELSSQETLMKELFPRARNVEWNGARPTIVKSDDPYNSGFKGFLTGEDTVMMVKYAEQPHRFGFSQKYPHRTYESMISTLYKFPWHSPETYTLSQRDALFTAVRSQLSALAFNIASKGVFSASTETTPRLLSPTSPTSPISPMSPSSLPPTLHLPLLIDLLYAGLNAPGFSEAQRYELLAAAQQQEPQDSNNDDDNIDASAATVPMMRVKMSPFAKWWPFEALGRKRDWEEDVVEYYVSALYVASMTSAPLPEGLQSPFGNVPRITNAEMTMADAANAEWRLLGRLLAKAFGDDDDEEGMGVRARVGALIGGGLTGIGHGQEWGNGGGVRLY